MSAQRPDDQLAPHFVANIVLDGIDKAALPTLSPVLS
jgi:hypothetical protein